MINIADYVKTHFSRDHGKDIDRINIMMKIYNDIVSKKQTTESDRKLIKEVNRSCIKMWKESYLKYSETKDREKTLSILLFGVFDFDAQVGEEGRDLLFYLDMYSSNSIYMDLLVWLKAIGSHLISPSINDFGISYLDMLIKNNKEVKSMKQARERMKNIAEIDLIDWEINQLIAIARKMCYYNRISIYLTHQNMIKVGIKKALVTQKKIEEAINKIEDVDFGLFFREIIIPMNEKTVKFHAKIKPYFIFLPIAADKFVMYQAISDRDAQKRGRIFIPIYYNGNDFLKEMIYTMGLYRWETFKVVAGVYWNDTVDGGLTGDFYDFSENYTKVLEQDEEQLEEFEEIRIKYQRSINRVFADLYVRWILKESREVLSLYKNVREMFWYYMPMSRQYKVKLNNNIQHSAFIRRSNKIRKEKYKMVRRIEGTLKPKNKKEEKLIKGDIYYWSQ